MTVRGSNASTEPGLQAEGFLHPPILSRDRRHLLMFIAALTGCRGAVPEQALSPPAPRATATAGASSVVSAWPFRESTRRQSFALEQHAVVTVQQDTARRVDTVSSRAEVAFGRSAGNGRLMGTVTVFHVWSGTSSPTTPRGLAVPFSFTAIAGASTQQLSFSSPVSHGQCASPQLDVVQSLRDLWFRSPDTLRVGTTWQDTASYVLCRDGIPLRASVRRLFRVTGAVTSGARTLLSVVREARSSLRGQAAPSGDSVTVTGQGVGQLTYTVDPALGEVRQATGSSRLELTLTSRARSQQVRQDVEVRLGPAT